MLSATLHTVAEFIEHSFLENLAVRSDNSILVTSLNAKQLWFVPASDDNAQVEPILLHTYDHPVTAVVETEPDVFHVALTDGYATHESHLSRVELRGWAPGETEPKIETVLTFDDRVRALNGGCLIAPTVLLLADCFGGFIWRVDLPARGIPSARIWLAHDSMKHDPLSDMKPPQPGVNGVRYAAVTNQLYYTSTAQKLFMRVDVDPETHEPLGEPEQVGGGTMADDFCIDEDAGVAYVTTHRENTIDRIPLNGYPDQPSHTVVGDPLDMQLLGPSSIAWGRRFGEYGRIAYVTSDGGTTAPPPDGKVRTAKVLRLVLE